MSFRIISVLLFLFVATSSFSKDYRASFFGIQSNGITLNTTSIQKAIDYNTNELEKNSDDYTMSEIFYMRGYTQSLKDVLEEQSAKLEKK